jgi:hypothetical protein
MGDFSINWSIFYFARVLEKKFDPLSRFLKFKIAKSGIKPWSSTDKHISCEHIDHKDNKKNHDDELEFNI